jgi:replicative superfamily II helicase
MSGQGRIIFTASQATEKAWENSRIGHGFLTSHLLNALQGAEEVRSSNGKISVYSLLEYVSKRVSDAARQIGKKQTPCLRGTIEGVLEWPILTPGPLFQLYFPEYKKPVVTEDINTLSEYGFPPELISAWSGSIEKLNKLQLDAINEFGIFNGEHLLVSAPTSSGKTMIGELAALKKVLNRGRSIFLFPLKALVNDKYNDFRKRYSSFGVKVIYATGDSSDQVSELMRGQYDICLMTYEKFSALVLAFPHILEHTGTLIVDEVQMITDKSRGTNLEFILTLLRMRRRIGIEPQLIALSAVIGATDGFENWLNARFLKREERPVPLDEGILTGDGSFRYLDSKNGEEKVENGYVARVVRKGGNQEWVIPLVKKLVEEEKQVIVFREKKGETRGAANYLAEALGLPPAAEALDRLHTGDPSISSQDLRGVLNHGVAFHNADLDRDERQVVESEFRKPKSSIRVLVSTTTLAMGINTPADAVIVAGLQHPGRPPVPYSVAEYKNIVGRAGRLGYSKHGSSFLLSLTPNEEHHNWEHYVLGKPEDLSSRFFDGSSDVRSVIVRVLSAANRTGGMSSKDIVTFLNSSFGAFRIQQETPESQGIKDPDTVAALNELEGHDLVEKNPKGNYILTELGWVAGHAGVEIESIISIVDVLRPLGNDEITDPVVIATTQLTKELEAVYFPINARGARTEANTWTQELRNQNISEYVVGALSRRTGDDAETASRLKKVAACLLWITDMPLNEIESVLTKHGGKWDGVAGPLRSVATRTQDLLPIVARVAELLHPNLDLSERSKRLSARLGAGVSAKILDLVLRTGTQLSRPDYQNLLKEGLSDMENLRSATKDKILKCVEGSEEKCSLIEDAIRDFFEKDSTDLHVPLIPPYEDT